MATANKCVRRPTGSQRKHRFARVVRCGDRSHLSDGKASRLFQIEWQPRHKKIENVVTAKMSERSAPEGTLRQNPYDADRRSNCSGWSASRADRPPSPPGGEPKQATES